MTNFPKPSKKLFLKLKNNAIRLLARRPYSIFEIKQYLQRKKSPPEISQKIINQLIKISLLDDQEFASWWIEQRSLLKPSGSRKLTAELRQKGISQAIISKALANCDFVALCQKAIDSRSYFSSKQLKNFLFRRGFTNQIIQSIASRNQFKTLSP